MRGIISIYAVVPLFLAFLVFWAFRRIGEAGEEEHGYDDESVNQLRRSWEVFKIPSLWAITFVAGLRGMAFLAFATFLPLYLNDLGLTPLVRNLHLGLLMATGVLFTPIVGYLSDKIGRKVVLIPGMVLLGVLSFILGGLESGIMLIIVLALLGTYLFGDQPILTAMALDIVGPGVATTTLGVLSFSRFVLSAASPLIAGWLYQSIGAGATFAYVASLFVFSAFLLLVIPIRTTREDSFQG